MKPPTYCNGAKNRTANKNCKKREKNVRNKFMEHFYLYTCFTTYLLLFAIRIYESCLIFKKFELRFIQTCLIFYYENYFDCACVLAKGPSINDVANFWPFLTPPPSISTHIDFSIPPLKDVVNLQFLTPSL